MFNTNVGSIDRVARVVVGLGVLSLFFVYPSASWRYVTLVGLVPLLTGLMGSCPLYSVLGLSTCSLQKS
jgi:hypothetical protein